MGVFVDVLPELSSVIKKKLALHGKFLDGAIAGLSPEERSSFEEYTDYCLSNGMTIEHLAACYVTIVEDTVLAQIYFNKRGVYQNSTFAEVEKFVYANPEYMERYMVGLALTAFLW